VSLPFVSEPISKPLGIDDHRNYLTEQALKPVFDRIRSDIKSIGNDIDEYSTQSYTGYKLKGRQFAWIGTHRNSIDIGSVMIDENKQLLDYDATRISSDQEDYSQAIEKIKNSFRNLGGKLKE